MPLTSREKSRKMASPNTKDSCAPAHPQSRLVELLENDTEPNWAFVDALIRELSPLHASSPRDFDFSSAKDDPLGRSLVSALLRRNPPARTLGALLGAFGPGCLEYNPVAFFTACKFAPPETVAQMTRHVLRDGALTDECPFPWIVSDHFSAEAAKAMLQVFPRVVLQSSSCLSSLCPLDFFLMSPKMVGQREFDRNAWTKFKLFLVAAECCTCVDDDAGAARGENRGREIGLSPVRVILQRILSRPGMYRHPPFGTRRIWGRGRCSSRHRSLLLAQP